MDANQKQAWIEQFGNTITPSEREAEDIWFASLEGKQLSLGELKALGPMLPPYLASDWFYRMESARRSAEQNRLMP